jgi:hypothetical protein
MLSTKPKDVTPPEGRSENTNYLAKSNKPHLIRHIQAMNFQASKKEKKKTGLNHKI